MDKVGKYAFIVGLALAAIAGLGFEASWVPWVLAVLGLVVGFLNVTAKESRGFLIAAIGLILSASAIQSLPYVGEVLTRVVANVVTFVSPAVLVVALKSLFEATKG
jgi:hypothetical protein